MGRVKNLEKVWSLTKPPSDPPPVWFIFSEKIDPHFYFEKCIYNGRDEFLKK